MVYPKHFESPVRLFGCHRQEAAAYAVAEIIEESTYVYENLLKAYPAGSVRLLKAIASEGCVKEILSGRFYRQA